VIAGLSLAVTRGSAAAACHSTCTQQLAECRQTCPGGGPGRRDCRAACAARSTCTAPGARIRTLAYVVNECTTDPQGRTSLKQKLLIRRGNCDPVKVREVASTPVPLDPSLGGCRVLGGFRVGYAFLAIGVFQRMAVLPDGSGVVFEVTKQLSLVPAVTPEPPEEGIFFVRTDGSGLRRLGLASPLPPYIVISDGTPPLGLSFSPTGRLFPVSPDGRKIAFIDFGPDTAGHEAPQIFLLDLRSGQRTQLTHQSRVASATDFGIYYPSFLDNRTIVFYSGFFLRGGSNLSAFQVRTDGSGLREISVPTPVPGAHIVPQFTVTGARSHVVQVTFPDRPAVNPVPGADAVSELFLIDGKNLLQLTDFGRIDTGGGLGGFIDRGRVVFFVASANPPPGENPGEICQLFSVSRLGGRLRQFTHLPSDGRPSHGCYGGFEAACSIGDLHVDQVTGTVLLSSSCDPIGANPFGDQIFAMRPDGTGLRQLTNARGMTTEADGTVHVEMPGPFAYPVTSR
jgi:hypothetical protein